MANVYSTQFIAINAIGGEAGYVVPAGRVAVIRSVSFWYAGTPGDSAANVVDLSTGTIVAYHLQLDDNEYWHLDTHDVVDTGAEFVVSMAGPNTISARVSGYLLTLP